MNKAFTYYIVVICCAVCFCVTTAFSKTGKPFFKESSRRHQNARKTPCVLLAGSGVPSISYVTPHRFIVNRAVSPLSPTNTGGAVPATLYRQVSTFAGIGTAGLTNGTATAASFKTPLTTATDASGNVYVADYGNNVIRKITPAGMVTTLAGSGIAGSANGTGTAASFNAPMGIVADASGNVYEADGNNNEVRKITSAGVVTTFAGSTIAGAADGTGTAARFSSPRGLAIDPSGNIYVADYGNNLIRKITSAGVVTTFAGSGTAGATNGTGTSATFHSPYGLAADASGNIYVADLGNNKIRKITSAGVVSTLAGAETAGSANGTGAAAGFHSPSGIAADPAGNVYVTDVSNNQIRKITSTGVVTTFTGSNTGTAGSANGNGNSAAFNAPKGISIDPSGNLYVADYNNNLIRKIIIYGYNISATLLDGLTFDQTTGVISGTPIHVNSGTTYTIAAYNSSGSSTASLNIYVTGALIPPVISYASPQTYTKGTPITPLIPTNTGGAVPAIPYRQVSTFAGNATAGVTNGTGTAASFNTPLTTATDAAGNVYVADYGNNVIRKITRAGVVTTLAGSGIAGSANGTGTAASFNQPMGLVVDASGNVYVAEAVNNQVRKITPAGVVTTFAGSTTAGNANGIGTASRFSHPHGLAIDVSGNICVADYGNNLIRKITPAGVVTTYAGSGAAGAANGTGAAASFHSPYGLTADPSGNLYVADLGNSSIRRISLRGEVGTLAGSATTGAADGMGIAASFRSPTGVAADSAGNVYVSDFGNNQIRKIDSKANVTTMVGYGSGKAGAVNGTGNDATFNGPKGISIDSSGNLYVADYNNNLIRKITTYGYATDGALRGGLTFNPTTGVISGTPTGASAAIEYTIIASNAAGISRAYVTITINGTGATAQSLNTFFKADTVNNAEPKVRPTLSPNGDGINDALTIDNIQQYPSNKMLIVDNNGTKVYEVSSYDNDTRRFDGHASTNGRMQKQGTYFYVLEYSSKAGLKRKTGYFVLKY